MLHTRDKIDSQHRINQAQVETFVRIYQRQTQQTLPSHTQTQTHAITQTHSDRSRLPLKTNIILGVENCIYKLVFTQTHTYKHPAKYLHT